MRAGTAHRLHSGRNRFEHAKMSRGRAEFFVSAHPRLSSDGCLQWIHLPSPGVAGAGVPHRVYVLPQTQRKSIDPHLCS